MPNDDHTFMQERLGFTAMAEIFGMPAPCANSARVTINGQYYGLYVNEERVGGNYIKRVFPEAPDGDLYEGGWSPKRLVLLEFPSMEQAQKWYRSSEYAPLIALRQRASRGKLVLVEGA